jgi:[ribosomal protein S5]-alanine N-acetyltransferase
MSSGPYASVLAEAAALRTARFELSPLRNEDADELFAELSDPEVVRFMDIDRPQAVEQVLPLIEWAQNIRASGTGVRWAIRLREGGGLIGTCGLHSLVWERGCRGEIGYDVGRPHWGERVMDEIMPAALDFGFRTLGLRRIEAMVTGGNSWSCALLERHGFSREGVLRDHAFWKDAFWDQLIYARLG